MRIFINIEYQAIEIRLSANNLLECVSTGGIEDRYHAQAPIAQFPDTNTP